MRTIQVVLDEDLLKAADHFAQRVKLNRSALLRNALREHLKKLHYQELERLDREGYERFPDSEDEDLQGWEEVAVWPPE